MSCWKFGGHSNAIQLAFEYDLNAFSMVCFETLNHTIETCTSTNHDDLEERGNMFGVKTSFEQSSWALVIGELSLFKRLSIPSFAFKDPFLWWCNHEGQFSNVAFLAKFFFGIPSSQIETKNIFNLVGVWKLCNNAIYKWKFWDRIITIVKNWPNDPWMNYMPHKNMKTI